MSDPQRLLAGIDAVFFDAVGTLLHPVPPALEVYAAAGRRHGSRHDAATIAARFTTAFERQEQIDHQSGLRTDEDRELRRWRSIVAEVLDDVGGPEKCFQELYQHFAQPSAWGCEPGAGEVLDTLASRGLLVGIASNFDHRLHRLVQELPELRAVQQVVISSEVGWRKPARELFEAVAAAARLVPSRILFVGDDWVNDCQGAGAAGMRAVLLDRRGRGLHNTPRIECLAELLAMMR
jgi:putative hydrolase of the HAD superfamily